MKYNNYNRTLLFPIGNKRPTYFFHKYNQGLYFDRYIHMSNVIVINLSLQPGKLGNDAVKVNGGTSSTLLYFWTSMVA